MFRRKEKAVECNSFEEAACMLQEDGRATTCAMHYICRSLVQGLVPPDVCLAAIVEGALSSEEHGLRARAFQVFKTTYLLGNQLVHWSGVRRAMQQEIANAESPLAFEAAFDVLTALPISQLTGWFCSKEPVKAMRGALVLEDIALRAISVRHIGALLVRVWHNVDDTGGGVDALLFATQPSDSSRHDLTSDEPRRIKENLADFVKECYKTFTLGILGRATTSDAQTGNLKSLSDSLIMFSTCSGALLQLVRCYNENRRGVSLDAWILALVNDGSSDSAGRDSTGTQASLVAHATSAKFYPFLQVVLHDLIKDIDVLIAKCNMCDKTDAQDPAALISQILLALLHEHHRFSAWDSGRQSQHRKKYAASLPVRVLTITKDAFSFGNTDEDGDETSASRTGNGSRVLQHMASEWAGVHLKEYMLRWREAALPTNGKASLRGNQEYVFGLATCMSGWRIIYTLVEILQFEAMQATRALLAAEVAEHLLQMLDVEVYSSSMHSCSSNALRKQQTQTGLAQAFAMLLLLLRFAPSVGSQLSAHRSVLRLLKLTYLHGHVSGTVCCRLMAELSATHLQPREEQDDEHVDDVLTAFLTTDTHTTGAMTAFLALDAVQEVVDIPPANPNLSAAAALSCKFNAFLVVAICRVCEASLVNAVQYGTKNVGNCTIYTQSNGGAAPAAPSERQLRQRCARVLSLLTNIKLVLYAFSSCIYWPIFLPSGESAQVAWVSLASLALQTLLPVDSTSPLLRWTAAFPEVRLEARKLTTVMIGLLDALLENNWAPSFSTASRSSILSLLSRGIVAMSKHTIGAGPWHDRTAQETTKSDKTERRPSVGMAGISYRSWTEEPINPLHGEIFARGEDLLRLLEEDILFCAVAFPTTDSGSSVSKHSKSRTSMSAQQVNAVDSIMDISKACLAVEDDAMATICMDMLNSAVQGDLTPPLRDYVCIKSQEVTALIAAYVHGEDLAGDLSPESPRNPAPPSPRPRAVPATLELQHKQQEIKEKSLFSNFDTSLSDASQDVLSIADDVASSHFPTHANAFASPDCDSAPTDGQGRGAVGATLCPLAVDGVSFSQISGSSDPLTVLAAVEFDKRTLQGHVRVKVVNSSGFKLDGYSVQLLLKSNNWFKSVQDVTRITKSEVNSRFEVSSRFSEGTSRASSLPDAYVAMEQEILKDKPLLVSGGLSADVAPGALQHSAHTEYVLHNGTSESTFNFQLKRLGAVEIVVRLRYQDLQEGAPLPDLWSLVQCAPGKTPGSMAGEDDARFTSEKMPLASRASTQCAPLRMSVSSQLSAYGRGVFNSFKSAAWTNRMQNWCDPDPGTQLPSPTKASSHRVSSPGIPNQVFSDLWNRCGAFSSTAIPLRAACHSSGVQYVSGQSITQLVDDSTNALERGVAGGLLPGQHYLNFSSRVNLVFSSKPNEFESMAWALQSVWGAEIGIRLCIWFDQGNGLNPGDALTTPSTHSDPLSLPASLTSVHSAELAAAAASSAAAGLVNAVQKQRSIGSYRAGLEMRASDAHTIACLLEDIDGLVAALTADVMEVHQAEFEDKFSDSRSSVNSKLNGMRPVGTPVPAVVQPANVQRGAFGLY